MAEIQNKPSAKSPAIFDKLTKVEFRKAWDGVIGMARKALAKREGLDPRFENRDHL